MTWPIAIVLLFTARMHSAPPLPETEPEFEPTERYQQKQVEGWTVEMNKTLDRPENQDLRDQTLKLLANQLYRISRVIPPEALARLRKIPIWIEVAEPHHPCMCYHTSPGWLGAHGMNQQKAGSVEIANARHFLDWSFDQPWMVLHELAHGYHHQVLGFDHAGIKACYRQAASSHSYETVLRSNGRKERAYALTNDREYFAELTEAYFGSNDFYPFVRAELKQHDPAMYVLLEQLWGVRQAKSISKRDQ
jgi:hypothetical protein